MDEKTIRRDAKFAEAVEIYEALHPETKHGASGRRGSGKGESVSKNDNVTFSEDTAAKTGKSRRTIERAVALGESARHGHASCVAIALNESEDLIPFHRVKRRPGAFNDHATT